MSDFVCLVAPLRSRLPSILLATPVTAVPFADRAIYEHSEGVGPGESRCERTLKRKACSCWRATVRSATRPAFTKNCSYQPCPNWTGREQLRVVPDWSLDAGVAWTECITTASEDVPGTVVPHVSALNAGGLWVDERGRGAPEHGSRRQRSYDKHMIIAKVVIELNPPHHHYHLTSNPPFSPAHQTTPSDPPFTWPDSPYPCLPIPTPLSSISATPLPHMTRIAPIVQVEVGGGDIDHSKA